jgi:hypothetical protein
VKYCLFLHQLYQCTRRYISLPLWRHQSFKALHSVCFHLFQSHGHVESEIAKWQKEIDQTEQQWLKKLQRSGSVESAAGMLQQSDSLEPATMEKLQHVGSAEPASTRKLQHSGSLEPATTGKPPSARQRTRQFVSDVHNGGSWEQNKPLKNNVQTAKSKIVEMGEWRNSGCMTPSECSTVSSDLDFDTDVPVVLPSVKELAKQFSGSTTSDSDSSVTKVSGQV